MSKWRNRTGKFPVRAERITWVSNEGGRKKARNENPKRMKNKKFKSERVPHGFDIVMTFNNNNNNKLTTAWDTYKIVFLFYLCLLLLLLLSYSLIKNIHGKSRENPLEFFFPPHRSVSGSFYVILEETKMTKNMSYLLFINLFLLLIN